MAFEDSPFWCHATSDASDARGRMDGWSVGRGVCTYEQERPRMGEGSEDEDGACQQRYASMRREDDERAMGILADLDHGDGL